MQEAWFDLDARERGLLLGLCFSGADAKVLDALGPGQRERCGESLRQLLAFSEPERRQRVQQVLAEAQSPLPAGLERLHPSWIEESLSACPAPLRDRVCELLPARLRAAVGSVDQPKPSRQDISSAGAWLLARLLFQPLAPLCVASAGPRANALLESSCDELLAQLASLGARMLGRSLAGSSRAIRASAMAKLGDPWAAVMAEASAQSLSADERAAAAALLSTRFSPAPCAPIDRLRAVGVLVWRRELLEENPASVALVAGRLPAALGRVLLGW